MQTHGKQETDIWKLCSRMGTTASESELGPRTVEVMDVGVEAPGLRQRGMEPELPVLGKPLAPKIQPGRHYLDMALPQGIINPILDLLYLQA